MPAIHPHFAAKLAAWDVKMNFLHSLHAEVAQAQANVATRRVKLLSLTFDNNEDAQSVKVA